MDKNTNGNGGAVGAPTLEINGLTNIRYESLKDFKKSVSWDAYEKAFSITREIVRSTEDVWNNSEKTGKYNKGEEGTTLRNRDQIYNIIFFTGDRGTGKTSVMLSYMEFLKDYFREWKYGEKNLNDLQFNIGAYMFTGIEYINASLLKGKEDILGSVLSKMLKKWIDEEQRSFGNSGIVREADYDYKKRQLRLQFSEVYERLKDLRSDKDIMQQDSDTFLDTLERLSLTWNVKQSFHNLVEAYLDIMAYPGSGSEIGGRNHFLMISIDDLDMNIQYGFELLEEIRTYLMVPNVIVLLSADYEQLEKICYNYHSLQFKDIKVGNENYINRLSREYLEKMVPAQRQIRLMSGKNWKYFSQHKIEIKYGPDAAGDGGLNDTLCNIIRKQMKDYFLAGFSPQSICIRYLTPDTLRETCSWINQIRGFKSLENMEGKQAAAVFEENAGWFWHVEFPRLCKKYYSEYGQKIFEMMEIMGLTGQMRLIKQELVPQIGWMREGKEKNARSWNGMSLLELLSAAERENKEMQEVASLILIYFTMKLSGLAVKLKGAGDDKEREECAGELLAYFSEGAWGIWGTWERKMLKPMTSAKGKKFTRIGRTDFNKENNCLTLPLKESYTGKDAEGAAAFIEKNSELLKNYQYLLLFYRLDRIPLNTDLWKRENGADIKMQSIGGGTFSLSGFVLNLLDGAKLVERFLKELPGLLFTEKSIAEEEKVKEILQKVSILSEEAKQAMKEPLLPIASVEFLVYMGERVQGQLGGGAVMDYNEYNEKEITVQIKSFLRVVIQCLKEFDGEYGSTYSENFEKFPLVSKIMKEEKAFIKMLVGSIQSHAVPYDAKEEELEWSGV